MSRRRHQALKPSHQNWPPLSRSRCFGVRVSDPDSDDAISKIELSEDGSVVATDAPNRNARCWPVSRKPEPGRHYYFVKVTQADGNMLWSAPVWVTAAEAGDVE